MPFEYKIGNDIYDFDEELTPAELAQFTRELAAEASPGPAQQAEQSGMLDGLLARIGRGIVDYGKGAALGVQRSLPFGADAKLVGAINSLLPGGGSYDEEQQRYLAGVEAAREAAPMAVPTGEAAGLLGQILLGGGALQAGSKVLGPTAEKISRAASTPVVSSGLGAAEGYTRADEAGGTDEEKKRAAKIGGLLGGLIPGAGKAAGALARTPVAQGIKAGVGEVLPFRGVRKAFGKAYTAAKKAEQAADDVVDEIQKEVPKAAATTQGSLFKRGAKVDPDRVKTVEVPVIDNDDLLKTQAETASTRSKGYEFEPARIKADSVEEIASDPAVRPTVKVPTLESQGLLPRIPKDDDDLVKALEQSVEMTKRKPPVHASRDSPIFDQIKSELETLSKRKNVSEFGLSPTDARYVNQLENRSAPAVARGMGKEMKVWEEAVEEGLEKGKARQKSVRKAYDKIRRPKTPKGR